MNSKTLAVNEIFGPTIQGEGKSAGKPVVFLRLAMCNLNCIWCDTPHTWNWAGTRFQHPEKYDKEKELHRLPVEEVLKQVRLKAAGRLNSLVISGGEPLLQQDALTDFLKETKRRNWWAEVETNGTMLLEPEFERLIDQINCSPKLSHSEHPLEPALQRRIRPDVLEQLARSRKTNFKFVVSSPNDVPEILEHTRLLRQFGNPEIRLMPLAQTKEELLSREQMVQRLCRENGFIYSSRLSVLIAGKERGI